MRGRCGLWDWDMARGRMFWSRSMFDMLGLRAARHAACASARSAALIHPDDGDLFELADAARRRATTIDRPRCSACATPTATGSGCARAANWSTAGRTATRTSSASPSTSPSRCALVERSQDGRHAPARRDRDHLGSLRAVGRRQPAGDVQFEISSSCTACPTRRSLPGTPYADVIAAGQQAARPHRRLASEGHARPGARTFEPQLEDGRWLQINERRTKDGGFVSVGTDITQLKQHEEKLVDSERRLMATIADLRQSRQKLEQQAQRAGRARREIRRGEGPRRGRPTRPSPNSSPT